MYARDNHVGASDLQQRLLDDSKVVAATEMLRMLADGTRLRLMWLLVDGEHDVTALVAALGVARPAVSQHLSKLRLAGLVAVRREGRHALYAVRDGYVQRLVTGVLHAASHRVGGIPEHD
ncbi:metalloregulator ArsR/SmtB family transcription factor [Micromonospora sp. KC723]|uniref:ArsR/SmtB family transcription factor n=1 Tax=Micromonospora sp. KC723 TaxID=2530381 RepID=UPI00104AD75A|nr:metalloregulator ArsR/SmtB family transcription factor [Micromonospora sp. KC723]TDB70305.1 transcriptional regulator [Micromonospora sp. KC723]